MVMNGNVMHFYIPVKILLVKAKIVKDVAGQERTHINTRVHVLYKLSIIHVYATVGSSIWKPNDGQSSFVVTYNCVLRVESNSRLLPNRSPVAWGTQESPLGA